MSSNKLFVQNFRTNDLKDHSGSQIEFGRAWLDFLEIDNSQSNATINLLFKSLIKTHENLNNKEIELKLAEVTTRGDRKTYANGSKSGHSALKEFFLYDLHLTPENNSGDYFAFYKVSELNYFLYYIPKLLHDNFLKFFESITPKVTINHSNNIKSDIIKSLQQIFYGAPGTGKSNKIKEIVNDKGAIHYRTTFHPDSDYSTFVGCYKPTMKVNTISKNGVETKEEQIVYRFVPQAFTKAYTAAWNTEDDVYLIIEEINRGNCAQIFGDLFQLLDRKNGVSEYPIDADTDLADYIHDELKDSQRDFPEGVKEGKKLVLPSNLYIWATMNTSDQSLFPIDSASKRRWDWKYIKIKDEHKGWKVDIDINSKDAEGNAISEKIDWWSFVDKINKIIASMTSSADKQLGYFFCKATKKTNDSDAEATVITKDTFVSKVIFYLWNDVFKDYGFEDASLFRYIEVNPETNNKEEKDLTFPDFYDKSGEQVNTERLTDFVEKVLSWQQTKEEQK